MRLLFENQVIDWYPTDGGKSFLQRIIYNPESKGVWGIDDVYMYTEYCTVEKGTALHSINAYMADGAKIIDFNFEEYDGDNDDDDDDDDD
jgi:hypothetical protein